MRSRTRLYAFPLLLSVFAFVACGGDDDDGGTGPDTGGDQLTQQESVEMLEALAAVGSFDFGGFGSFSVNSADGAALVSSVPISDEFDETFPCPEGGSVRADGQISGDVDENTGAADANLTMVQTHMDCVGSSDSGTTFTFNGAPNITTSMDFNSSPDGTFSLNGTWDGSLGWETSGKSGTCGFDLTFSFSGSSNSFSGSMTGTVCGQSVDENIDESFAIL